MARSPEWNTDNGRADAVDARPATFLIPSLARRLVHNHPDDTLHRCPLSVLVLLNASLVALLDEQAADDPSDALITLRHLAHQKINAPPFHAVQPQWLRLYTDATLALVLARVRRIPRRVDEWRTWVRWLDMVIIVAGAVGPQRDEYVAEVIKGVQREFAGKEVERYERMARDTDADADDDDAPPLVPPLSIHYAPLAIPTPSQPPFTPPPYPIILRRYADPSHCPALRLWHRAAHLLARAGPGRVVPVEIGTSYTDVQWGQRIVPFEVFLQRIGYDLTGLCDGPLSAAAAAAAAADEEIPTDQPLYLAQHDLLAQFPRLREDIGAWPDYIYTAPATHNGETYVPPGNEERLVVNVWVGNGGGTHGESVTGGVVSPAHTDPYFNCYLQILGTKRVWLAPPHVADAMDAFPERTDDDGACAASDDDDDDDDDDLVTSYTTNTSRVPIFVNPDRRLGPTYERRYKRFYERAWPESREAVLQPGDMLLMPPKWWHAMRSEGDGVAWSLSMWY